MTQKGAAGTWQMTGPGGGGGGRTARRGVLRRDRGGPRGDCGRSPHDRARTRPGGRPGDRADLDGAGGPDHPRGGRPCCGPARIATVLGAGTVLDRRACEAAIAAGARFIVSPVTDPPVPGTGPPGRRAVRGRGTDPDRGAGQSGPGWTRSSCSPWARWAARPTCGRSVSRCPGCAPWCLAASVLVTPGIPGRRCARRLPGRRTDRPGGGRARRRRDRGPGPAGAGPDQGGPACCSVTWPAAARLPAPAAGSRWTSSARLRATAACPSPPQGAVS